jgi:hypothetical protein
MVTVADFIPVVLGVNVMIWFKGVSLPLRLPRFELVGVKSDEPLIVTVTPVSWFAVLPPVAVLSNIKVLALLLPISTSPKLVLLFTAGELADPVKTEFPFPETAKVP